MVHGSVHGFFHGSIHGLVYGAHHDVLLEHVGLPCVLPFAVHLDLGHLPDTQGYFGLLSELLTPAQPSKSYGVVVVGGP